MLLPDHPSRSQRSCTRLCKTAEKSGNMSLDKKIIHTASAAAAVGPYRWVYFIDSSFSIYGRLRQAGARNVWWGGWGNARTAYKPMTRGRGLQCSANSPARPDPGIKGLKFNFKPSRRAQIPRWRLQASLWQLFDGESPTRLKPPSDRGYTGEEWGARLSGCTSGLVWIFRRALKFFLFLIIIYLLFALIN